MHISDFVIPGLAVEQKNADDKNLSGFDKMNAKFVSDGINPVYYDDKSGYIFYDNNISLYTRVINTYDDLPDASTPGVKNAKGADISNLHLTDEKLLNMVIDDYTTMSNEQKSVFNKYKHNMDKMGCGIESLHKKGYTGYGTAALLDQKYCPHDIYKDKVKSTTDIGTNTDSYQEPSWHTAAMLSIMHKTAPDVEIIHYCCTDNDPKIQTNQFAQAINDIIKKNKTLPDDEKVRTIVIGYGFYPQDPNYKENLALCKRAIDEGIFICSNNIPELYGIEWSGADRDPKGDVNSPESYRLLVWQNEDAYKNIKKENLDTKFLYIPQQHLTIAHHDGKSIEYEGLEGGVCWSNSVGTLYNDFLSIKHDLKFLNNIWWKHIYNSQNKKA